MQQRRFRPGDVLDDYCPRERRITDHAVVAMIDDTIKQTRCCVCDAEHEFKNGKLPAQRRRKGQSALFTQVLEGLQGPQPARLSHPDADEELTVPDLSDDPQTPDAAATFEPLTAGIAALPETPASPDEPSSNNGHSTRLPAAMAIDDAAMTDEAPIEEGPVRRSLIRATLPRPEGHAPPARVIPEFTIRQPNHGRVGRHGRRRGGQMHSQGNQGPMRFGRGGPGNGQGHGQGQGQGQGQGHGQRSPGGRNRSRRGGKKR